MIIVKTVHQLRKALKEARFNKRKIGFVPTMGYLHEGHLSLVRACKRGCDVCVVSIFVNQKQFGPREDYDRYPRDIRRDATMLVKENVDILFIPSNIEIYPNGYLTYVDVENLDSVLCGKYRPGHFKGVVTVVAKLLNMVQPDVIYLGQKDAQQVVVLSKMVADLNFPVRLRVCPIIREKNGLAKSSRNVFLTPQERSQAPILFQALVQAKRSIQNGEESVSKIISFIKKKITRFSVGKIQYVACVNANTLQPLKVLEGRVLIAISVFFGKVRLIDNVIIPIKKKKS
ncbi:MAG: pantoate--beta-alanine ligase [Candidatus Omnitrophica bacterium]|nr:pantoate--beta-alanine ligase [Candidatus Omnitrophota bacterium]